MKITLFSRNLVPTAPQTTLSFPFSKKDPCIINEIPDVYICGNCEKFQQETFSAGGRIIKLIALPKFSQDKTMYLLDLNDYSVYCVEYK